MDFAAVLALIAKAGGSFAGAALALIFLPPKSIAEFWTRASFSIISGVIFADTVRDKLAWPETIDRLIAAGAGTSALSWFCMGMIVRVIGAWKPKDSP